MDVVDVARNVRVGDNHPMIRSAHCRQTSIKWAPVERPVKRMLRPAKLLRDTVASAGEGTDFDHGVWGQLDVCRGLDRVLWLGLCMLAAVRLRAITMAYVELCEVSYIDKSESTHLCRAL